MTKVMKEKFKVVIFTDLDGSLLDKETFKRSDTKFDEYSKFRNSEMKKTFCSSQSERLGL